MSDDKNFGTDSLSHTLLTSSNSKDDSASDRNDSDHNSLISDGDHGDGSNGGDGKSDDSRNSSNSSYDRSGNNSFHKHRNSSNKSTAQQQSGQLSTANVAGVSVSPAAGSGLAGAGDASDINGGATAAQANNVNETAKQQTLELQLKQGTAFVAHKKTVILHTPNGDIKITPGAVAYVLQVGNEVSVYNFSDTHRGDISAILPSKKSVPVPYGHQLLLTKNLNAKFEEVNPAKSISHNNIKNTGTQEGLALFDTQFAPLSALDSAIEFKQLMKSPSASDKKIADQILKSAVIISNLEGQ